MASKRRKQKEEKEKFWEKYKEDRKRTEERSLELVMNGMSPNGVLAGQKIENWGEETDDDERDEGDEGDDGQEQEDEGDEEEMEGGDAPNEERKEKNKDNEGEEGDAKEEGHDGEVEGKRSDDGDSKKTEDGAATSNDNGETSTVLEQTESNDEVVDLTGTSSPSPTPTPPPSTPPPPPSSSTKSATFAVPSLPRPSPSAAIPRPPRGAWAKSGVRTSSLSQGTGEQVGPTSSAAKPNFSDKLDIRLGFVAAKDGKVEERCNIVVRGEDGQLYFFKTEHQERGGIYKVFSQVLFQVEEGAAQRDLPFNYGTATDGTWVKEIGPDLLRAYPKERRKFMQGTITNFRKTDKGDAWMGEIDTEGHLQWKDCRFWANNFPNLQFKNGLKVSFGTYTRTVGKTKYVTVDTITPDFSELEKELTHITHPDLQLALSNKIGDIKVSVELGVCEATTKIPGFPAAMWGKIHRGTNPITQMLEAAEEYHLKATQEKDILGENELRRATRMVERKNGERVNLDVLGKNRFLKSKAKKEKLNVLINPYSLPEQSPDFWYYAVDNFFDSPAGERVGKFYILTKVDRDTNSQNALSINDFTHRLTSRAANRLIACHILGEVETGLYMRLGDGGKYEFPAHTSEAYALLELSEGRISPRSNPAVTDCQNWRPFKPDMAYDDSLYEEIHDYTKVVYVSHPTGNTPEQRRAMAQLLEQMNISGMDKPSKVEGWTTKVVRCNSREEVDSLVNIILQDNASEHNPLLVFKAEEYENGGVTVKMEPNFGFTTLFGALLERVPAIPIGKDTYRIVPNCPVTDLIKKMQSMNNFLEKGGDSTPAVRMICCVGEERNETYWLQSPPTPPHVEYDYFGTGPGALIVAGVPPTISNALLKRMRGMLDANDDDGNKLGEVITFTNSRGNKMPGLRIEVRKREIGRARSGKLTFRRNSYRLLDAEGVNAQVLTTITEGASNREQAFNSIGSGVKIGNKEQEELALVKAFKQAEERKRTHLGKENTSMNHEAPGPRNNPAVPTGKSCPGEEDWNVVQNTKKKSRQGTGRGGGRGNVGRGRGSPGSQAVSRERNQQ